MKVSGAHVKEHFAIRYIRITLAAIMIAAGSALAHAQTSTASTSPTPSAKATDKFEGFRRFFQFDALSAGVRFRYIRNENGLVGTRQVQYQILARGRFKFDRKGRYSIGFEAQTGNVFNGGWNNTGVGTGHRSRDINLRQLYFDARPTSTVEMQVGGLGIERGENTEITTYDNDGYIVGERLHITARKRLFFDDIAVTRANIGDLNQPNVFRRFRRLSEANYYQLLVRKTVNKGVSLSADYTYEGGIDTLHQGARLTLPHRSVLDTLVIEAYERLDPHAGYGFAFTGQRKLDKYLTLSGGFARIDRPMFNADRFPPGDRVFASVLVPITRDFSLNAVAIQGINNIAPTVAKTRLEMIVSWNLLATLHRLKIQ